MIENRNNKYARPREPGTNPDGYRKVRGLAGKTFVGGSPMSRVSERRMRILGRLMLAMALLPWASFGMVILAAWSGLINLGWLQYVGIGGFFLANLFFLIAELTAHRELPGRGRSLLILWGPIILAIVFGIGNAVWEGIR